MDVDKSSKRGWGLSRHVRCLLIQLLFGYFSPYSILISFPFSMTFSYFDNFFFPLTDFFLLDLFSFSELVYNTLYAEVAGSNPVGGWGEILSRYLHSSTLREYWKGSQETVIGRDETNL